MRRVMQIPDNVGTDGIGYGFGNGAPGQRRPNYYAAFVLDPDGNNIEAVCRGE